MARRSLVGCFLLGTLLYCGCGEQTIESGGRQPERAVRGGEGMDAETASYYREQAKQVFGSDVIRIGPLPGQRGGTPDEGRQRRALDTLPRRNRGPNSDLLMAEAAMKSSANASAAWVEPDRPERQDRRTASAEPRREPPPLKKTEPPPDRAVRDTAGDTRSPDRASDTVAKKTTEPPLTRSEKPSGEVAPRPVATAVAPDPVPVPQAPAVGQRDWSIALVLFRGEGNAEAAKIALGRIQNEGGLPDAFIQRRGPACAVVYGRYPNAEDATAQADLKRIQAIEINGVRLYAGTYICPPPEGNAPIRGEYDLRSAKNIYGKDALYTLQVGFYSREDVAKLTPADTAEIRKAAEEAALRLRQEGELAFFYHGPNRSLVLVGIFELSDFDPQKPGVESQRLREAKHRHPYNLCNGAGYTGKVPGMNKSKLVPSGLVALPKR